MEGCGEENKIFHQIVSKKLITEVLEVRKQEML